MSSDALTDCPFYLVTRASLAVVSWLKRALQAAGVGVIRPSYLGVLMCLWQEDGLKGVDLGRRAGLEPSTMTGLLDRMERDGLVVRTPDPRDRRAQRIRLTEEGRRVRATAEGIVDASLVELLNGVPDEDVEQMKNALRSILANSDRGPQ